MASLFGFFNLGAPEIIVLMVVGVILFGRRLPEVGRYLGKGIVEFKKGLKGIEDEAETSHGPTVAATQAPEPPRAPQRIGAAAAAAPAAPKFQDQPIDSEGQQRYQG